MPSILPPTDGHQPTLRQVGRLMKPDLASRRRHPFEILDQFGPVRGVRHLLQRHLRARRQYLRADFKQLIDGLFRPDQPALSQGSRIGKISDVAGGPPEQTVQGRTGLVRAVGFEAVTGGALPK